MMVDVQSVVIYLGLAVISFFIAKYAELTNSRRAVWLIVIILSLVSGFRAVTVGIDTKTYDSIFRFISSGNTAKIYGIEESFIYICSKILRIWNNNQFLFVLFAFISYGLCIFRLWHDREWIAFRWSVFSFYILLFPFSLNGLRQFVAISIVFYSTKFIKEGKYLKFAVTILVASLFHSSAVIGLAYFIFELIFLKYFDEKRRLYIFLLAGIGMCVSISVALGLLNRYSRYFDKQSQSLGVMMFFKIAMLLFSIVIVDKPLNKKEQYYRASGRWSYFVGLLLNSLSYVFLYMGRIGLYFYIFESIHIGCFFKTKKQTSWVMLSKFAYVLILMYYLYNNIANGGQGEIPYRFYWQE